MGKSSYKKFMKKEKAKVKLKKKELLPKGQNVTDLNYKVKKIVLKTQLKDHSADEVVSKRKLNTKEVLSRLAHYNNHAQIDALSDLESILRNPRSDYASNLITILNQLGKAVICNFGEARKKSTSLMAKILSEVSNSPEGALACASVVPRIACGLTSLDAGVRADTVAAASAICLACPSGAAPALPVLLPALIGLLAVRTGSSWSPATPPLSSPPVLWRSRIISTITLLLQNYIKHSWHGKEQASKKDVFKKNDDPNQVQSYPTFLRPTQDTQLNLGFNSTASLLPQTKSDWKEETSILVSVTLDSFSEALANCDADINGLVISKEICDLLENSTAMILALRYLLVLQDSQNEKWFTNTFGNLIHSRLVSGKFPYRVSAGQSKGRRQSGPTQISSSAETANARLALLALNVATTEAKRHDITKHLPSIASNEPEFAQALLISVRIDPKCLTYAGPDAMRSIAHDPSLYHLHQEGPFIQWISKLFADIKNCSKEDVATLLHLLSLSSEDVVQSLNRNISEIISSLDSHAEVEEVIKLLYRVDIWNEKLLESLSEVVLKLPISLQHRVMDIMNARCLVDEILQKEISQHSWWREKLNIVCS